MTRKRTARSPTESELTATIARAGRAGVPEFQRLNGSHAVTRGEEMGNLRIRRSGVSGVSYPLPGRVPPVVHQVHQRLRYDPDEEGAEHCADDARDKRRQ